MKLVKLSYNCILATKTSPNFALRKRAAILFCCLFDELHFSNFCSLYHCLLPQVALLLKIFPQVTFIELHICFVNIKGYFDWQKASHATFFPRFFFFVFYYFFLLSFISLSFILSFTFKVFSQLKNKHCNINIEASFSCSRVVKFYMVWPSRILW